MQHRFALLALLVAAAAMLTLTPVHAASFAVTTGRVDLDRGGHDPARTGGVRLGAEVLDVGAAEIDLELDLATDIDPGSTATGRDWHFRSAGAHVALRTAGPLYLIGRAGVARQRVETDLGDDHATRRGVGLGLGLSAGLLQLELLAQRYPDSGALEDITWLTAALRF